MRLREPTRPIYVYQGNLQACDRKDGRQNDLLSERDLETPKKWNRLSSQHSPSCKDQKPRRILTRMKIRALRQTFAMPLPTKKAWKLTQDPFEFGSNKSHWWCSGRLFKDHLAAGTSEGRSPVTIGTKW